MNDFRSVLLPLDGSTEAAKAAGCALWLSERLRATLHVVHATPQPLPNREALTRLRLPHADSARVIVHQPAENADRAVVRAIDEHKVSLVVMSAYGESASAGATLQERLGSTARAVIETSQVPVVLRPARYREALPWTSMLAAASGEPAADRALEAAAQLAAALQLTVTVLHAGDGAPGAGAYADAPHHEYGRRLQEMVERGVAGCTPEQAHCVHQVLLRRGDPAAALLEHASREATSLLALGWHGALGRGRALVLKRFLEEATCALLLVRTPETSHARLKVGDEIDD
jgi:nucleotide-binding universal stress UspA family protein